VDGPAPYTGNQPYLFVSYSHADEEIVLAEILELQNQGHKVWYDTGITPGSEWTEQLASRIKGCSRFVYFITPNSVESEHCRREVTFAQTEGRNVLAVHLKETILPDGLRLSLENRQAILRWRLDEADFRERLNGALAGNPPAIHIDAPLRRRKLVFALFVLLLVGSVGLIWLITRDGEPPTLVRQQITDETWERRLLIRPFRDLSQEQEYPRLLQAIEAELIRQLDTAAGYRLVPVRTDVAGGGPEVILDGYLRPTLDSLLLVLELSNAVTGELAIIREFAVDPSIPVDPLVKDAMIYLLNFADMAYSVPKTPTAKAIYQDYLATRMTGNDEAAIPLAEQILTLEPDWVQGHLDLAIQYGWNWGATGDTDLIDKMAAALDTAEALGAADNPYFKAGKGRFLWSYRGDMEGAEEVLRDLILTQKGFGWGYMYALLMLQSGLVEEASKFLDLHTEAFSYQPSGVAAAAIARGIKGDIEGMLKLTDHILDIEPEGALNHFFPVTWALVRSDRDDQVEELASYLERLAAKPETDSIASLVLAYLTAQVAWVTGDRETGLAIADATAERGMHAWSAIAYMVWDDPRADEYFKLASQPPHVARRDIQLYQLAIPPKYRNDPRVLDMLRAFGFTPEWRLELCRRASSLPQQSGISCDPTKYTEVNDGYVIDNP
jgi:hypothetical protein